jgi:fucose permease
MSAPSTCNETTNSGIRGLDWASAAGLLVYSSSATVTPICLVILARELAFSLTAAGALEVARSLLIVGTLLLSGFLAGRFGKARSLGYSALVLGLGMLVYTVAPAYGVVMIAMALFGVGGGVLEGLINPLVQDLHPRDSGKYLNFVNGFWSVGVLGTVLIAGDLLTRGVSWRYVVAVLGVLSVFSGLLFLILERRLHRSPRLSLREVLANKKTILGTPGFWRFFLMMFLAGGVEGAYTFWSASLIQLEHGGLPRAGGIATAFFAGGMIVGRFASAWWVTQHQLRRLIVISALAGLPVGIWIPLIQDLHLACGALFAAGLTVACFWPSIQSHAVDRLKLEVTSLFILLSCGGIPGFAFASLLMGWIGDHAGLRTSFFLIPVMLTGLILLLIREPNGEPETRE